MKAIVAMMLAVLLGACASVGQKAGGDTAFVCHKGKNTLELPREAVQAHLDHGDRLGMC